MICQKCNHKMLIVDEGEHMVLYNCISCQHSELKDKGCGKCNCAFIQQTT